MMPKVKKDHFRAIAGYFIAKNTFGAKIPRIMREKNTRFLLGKLPIH
jgi:hypothetical protein